MSNKPICVFESPIWTRSGYGDWAEALAKSILRYGKLDLYLVPTIWGACSKKDLSTEMNDPETKELLNRVLRNPLPRQPDIFMKVSIPTEFSAPAKFNIGLTAGIETTAPAGQWIEGMNRTNLNIVLSKFNKDVFAATNYTKKNPNGTTEELVVKPPMEVLFWGVDIKKYYKTSYTIESVEESFKNIHESFAFLFVGQWTNGNMRADRKGIGFLIKTFLETFADIKNPPCLIIKTSGAQLSTMDKYDCITKMNDVTNMVKSSLPNAKLPNVYLLHGELDDVEMNALYNHEKVKVHVSFTHGEGFGSPLLQATLSGKPVISSNWSGHLDFLNPKYCKFFDGKLIPVPDEALNEWFIKDARWFEVDYKAAGEKMKHVFNNYDSALLENSEKLRLENIEKFSTTAMDKEFHAILDKYLPKFAEEKKIILPKLKTLNSPPTSKE